MIALDFALPLEIAHVTAFFVSITSYHLPVTLHLNFCLFSKKQTLAAAPRVMLHFLEPFIIVTDILFILSPTRSLKMNSKLLRAVFPIYRGQWSEAGASFSHL